MHLIIDGKIRIKDCPNNHKTIIKKAFTLLNPQYQMACKMAQKDAGKRKMIYAIPRTFGYYEEDGDDLIIGRGAAQDLCDYFEIQKLSYTYDINRSCKKVDEPITPSIKLRDYQVNCASQVLESNQGVLKLGTAYGKTIIAFRLIEKTQYKTLIICCKSEANELAKYQHDFKKIYGKEIGVIQGKKFDVKDVTVATMSTLTRRDMSDFEQEFGMVIVDECHAGMSEKRLKKLQELAPERFYGMSGTPGRANGQGQALSFYYGPILVDEKLPQDKPSVHVYKSGCEAWGDEYHEMEEAVVTDNKRNSQILLILKELMQANRKILLLTKRIEHGQILKRLILHNLTENRKRIIALSSKDSASIRAELVEAMRSEKKDFQVLIGTYSLFSTGVDIPLLDTVVLGMSTKVDGDYDATLVQSIGRVLRLHDKKQKPLVIDIDDDKNKIMHRHHLSRMKVYKREGWDIIKK